MIEFLYILFGVIVGVAVAVILLRADGEWNLDAVDIAMYGFIGFVSALLWPIVLVIALIGLAAIGVLRGVRALRRLLR